MKVESQPRMHVLGVLIFSFLVLAGVLAFSLLAPSGSGGPAPQPGQDKPLPPTATVAPLPPLTPKTAPLVEQPTPSAFPPLPVPVITAIPPSLPEPFNTNNSSGVPISTPLPTFPPPAETMTPDPDYDQGGHDYGAWRYDYSLLRSWDDFWATVRYDDQSLAGIQAYVQANRALAANLAQQGGGVRVDITFRNYVAPDQFRAWMRQRALFAAWSGLRVVDGQGVRGDLPIRWELDNPLPQRELDQWLTANSGYTLRGVYYVNAMVDARQLPSLIADPLVFLVDVTPNIVQRDVFPRYPRLAPYLIDKIAVSPSSPFRRMEDLGLARFQN